jgi:hypothetical protein
MCVRYGRENKSVSCGIISQIAYLMMQTQRFSFVVPSYSSKERDEKCEKRLKITSGNYVQACSLSS